MITIKQRKVEISSLAAFVLGGALLAWLFGRLDAHFVPDSAGYLNYSFASLEQMSRAIRTPGYPMWLAVWRRLAGIEFVPLAQVVLHAVAAWWFAMELRRLHMPTPPALIAGIAVAIGCTPVDHVNTISTDSLAASVGVCVVCSLLRWSSDQRSMYWGFVTVGFGFLAIMLRPAFLFLIPWMLLAGGLLRYLNHRSLGLAVRGGLHLSIALLVPVLIWMMMRWVVVGDFGMLPFGHQNLGGVVVQLVSDQELKDLPGSAGQLGRAVVDQKASYVASGHSFAPGQPQATMTIDNRWDDMTYLIVIPAAKQIAGDDTVAQHQAIAVMNRQIIRRYPQRYLIWLAKNARRGAWAIAADIVMHPVFLTVIVVTFLWAMFGAAVGVSWGNPCEPTLAFAALTIVALSYLFANLGFTILTSPAIGRFGDSAAIFLPAWFGVMMHRCCCRSLYRFSIRSQST